MSSSASARKAFTGALSWLGVGAIAGLVWSAVLLLPPLIARPPQAIEQAFIGAGAQQCKPEPVEQLRYLLAIALAPLAFMALHALIQRMTRAFATPTENSGALRALVAAACAVQAVLCVLALQHWNAHMLPEHKTYFDAIDMLGALPALLAVLAFMAITVARSAELAAARIRMPHAAIAVAIAALFLGSQLLSAIFTDATFILAPRPTAYHIPFPMGELVAVVNGRTPLVDFFPQYQNFLSLLLRPWFALFGVSVGSFTGSMALLACAAFAGVFLTLRACLRSSWTTLALFVPYVLLALDAQEAGRFRRVSTFSYYAVGPLRYVGPFVLAALCVWTIRKPSRGRSLLVALCAGAVALNNLDFGIPACVATCVAVIVGDAAPRWPSLSGIVRRVALFGAALVATLFAYSLFARVSSGAWPAWQLLSSYQRIFALSGFMMLPMPSQGLHFVIYTTFMAAIFRGYARRLAYIAGETADSTDDARQRVLAAMLVWSGVFGSGAAMYYVGRSHAAVIPALFGAWGVSVMLLIIDLVEHWHAAQREAQARGLLRALLILPTLALSFLLLAAFSTAARATNPLTELERLRTQTPFLQRFNTQLSDLVAANTTRGEAIMIAAPFGHAIAENLGVDNVYPFASSGSLIITPQLELVMKQIEARGVRKVFGTLTPDFEAMLRAHGFQLAGEAALDQPSMVITMQLTDGQNQRFVYWRRAR